MHSFFELATDRRRPTAPHADFQREVPDDIAEAGEERETAEHVDRARTAMNASRFVTSATALPATSRPAIPVTQRGELPMRVHEDESNLTHRPASASNQVPTTEVRAQPEAALAGHRKETLANPAAPAPSTNRSRARHPDTPPLLAARGLFKSYRKGRVAVPVLRGVDFQVYPEEFVSMVGQSGSGKSTLLHVLGTLDAPDSGEILYEGQRIDNLAAAKRDALRNQQFGMVFQFYHLLPELTTLENVLMPVMIKDGVFRFWRNQRTYRRRACELLEMVGLSHRLRHQPRELSGGEMQRTAIARALLAQPRLLLADEPTGNLDREHGEEVLRILRTLNREQKLTIVMVTHDSAIADQADRTVRLAEGQVQVS